MLKLLEMQRHAMLMYTSCGWFFDELSGLETVQVIHYAGRALRLAEECSGEAIEAEFLQHLANAKSNLPEHGDGARIYEKWVKPAVVDIQRVAGHYAISSLFENYPEKTRIYCYEADRLKYSLEAEGKLRLANGCAKFQSAITQEAATLDFSVLHLGDHNLTAGVRHSHNSSAEDQKKLVDAFAKADTAEVIRLLDQVYGKDIFSLRLLFRDEQRKIAGLILNDSLNSAAAVYRTVFESQAPLIRFLNGLDIPVPNALKSAAEIALNNQLQQYFERPELDSDSIQSLLREAAASNIALDATTLEYKIRRRIENEAARFAARPYRSGGCGAHDQAARSDSFAAFPGRPVGGAESVLSPAAHGLPEKWLARSERRSCGSPAARGTQPAGFSVAHPAASRLEMSATRVPSATYRIQLNGDFRFADVHKILDYLSELGISDLYLSPILASRKGSGHGYDVVDPTRINPDLGSEEEFAALQANCRVVAWGFCLIPSRITWRLAPRIPGGWMFWRMARNPPLLHFSMSIGILTPAALMAESFCRFSAVHLARPSTPEKSSSVTRTAASSCSISSRCFRLLPGLTTRS